MNQAQAIVTVILRIAGFMGLLFFGGILVLGMSQTLSPADFHELSSDPNVRIQVTDFVGGTVVHVNWMGYLFLGVCLVMLFAAKQIAIWITPKIDSGKKSESDL